MPCKVQFKKFFYWMELAVYGITPRKIRCLLILKNALISDKNYWTVRACHSQ